MSTQLNITRYPSPPLPSPPLPSPYKFICLALLIISIPTTHNFPTDHLSLPQQDKLELGVTA